MPQPEQQAGDRQLAPQEFGIGHRDGEQVLHGVMGVLPVDQPPADHHQGDICVAIYAVLIQSVAISGDAINSIWSIVGYTVLLCFSLFKTSSVTKSVLGAH